MEVIYVRKKITEGRKRRGVNTTEMAADLSITEGHLRGIERGRNNPTLKLAFEISAYLKIPVDELFEDLKVSIACQKF